MTGAAAQIDAGTDSGVGIAWGKNVGRLTIGQCRKVLAAVESGMALAAAMPDNAQLGSTETLGTFLSSAPEPCAGRFLDDLIAAMAAVADINSTFIQRVPLDQFIDGVCEVFQEVMRQNSDYLAGPVTEAISRLTDLIVAMQSEPPK